MLLGNSLPNLSVATAAGLWYAHRSLDQHRFPALINPSDHFNFNLRSSAPSLQASCIDGQASVQVSLVLIQVSFMSLTGSCYGCFNWCHF